MGHDSPGAILDERRRLAGSDRERPSAAVALGTSRLRASAPHSDASDLCRRLLLRPAPGGTVSGCGSATSKENARSTAPAMARADTGSSRSVRVLGEIRAHPATDPIQSQIQFFRREADKLRALRKLVVNREKTTVWEVNRDCI